MTAPVEAPVEAPISVEELNAAFDLESELACEGFLIPVCSICGMNCTGCKKPAEFAVRNDCGCLYLMCSDCRRRAVHHFAAHPELAVPWPCTKCGGWVTGGMSRWTPL